MSGIMKLHVGYKMKGFDQFLKSKLRFGFYITHTQSLSYYTVFQLLSNVQDAAS